MFNRFLTHFIVFLPVFAYGGPFQTTRSMGFVGAGSVSSAAMDGFASNPASIAIKADLVWGGGYIDGYRNEEDHQRSYYGWFVDSLFGALDSDKAAERNDLVGDVKGAPFAASFSYFSSKTTGPVPMDFDEYTLGFGKVFGQRLTLGFSASAYDMDLRQTSLSEYFWTGSVGAIYKISRLINIGISGVDLLETADVDTLGELEPIPRVRLGFSYGHPNFYSFFIDLEHFLENLPGRDELSWAVGIESKAADFFSIRLGVGHDQFRDELRYGAGLSFLGPRLKVHYSAQLEDESKEILHSVDFSMPLW